MSICLGFNPQFVKSGFGVRFRSPLSALQGFSVPSLTIKDEQGIGEVREDDVPSAESEMPEETLADPFVATGDFVTFWC